MKIAIIGAGGVGGYFGGRLQAAGEDVHFVARGAHLRAMQSGGLRLQSPKGDLHLTQVDATDDPATIGPSDIVLFTVKMYDIEPVARLLTPLLAEDTAVITLQNGVEAIEILARHVPRAHVVGGVAYITSVISEPGAIRHTALDTLIVGELDGRCSTRLERLVDAGTRAGFQAKLSERIDVDLWAKFVRLTVFSGITAVSRSPLGVVRDDPEMLAMVKAAIQESLQVARAHGVPLPDGIVNEIMAMVAAMPAESKSSMLEDLERGRRLELPWLSGAVVRLGQKVGVPTPIHQFIATVLRPFVDGRAGHTGSDRKPSL